MFSADPYANRFLYTGREFLKEANLYDYRNRVYSPDLGRFLQPDPIRFSAGDGNLYRYVGNNPINYTDSLGLLIETIADIGFIAYDLYRIVKDNVFGDCDNLGENLGSLGGNIVGAAIPFATGGGLAVRAGMKSADAASSAAKGTPPIPRGRSPEIPSGQITESGLMRQAENYLGAGYKEVSPGRYVSADGTRQFRYGAHETRNPANHHAHFESLEGVRVTENGIVKIVPDP
jgi:RHS repeat-associated protein